MTATLLGRENSFFAKTNESAFSDAVRGRETFFERGRKLIWKSLPSFLAHLVLEPVQDLVKHVLQICKKWEMALKFVSSTVGAELTYPFGIAMVALFICFLMTFSFPMVFDFEQNGNHFVWISNGLALEWSGPYLKL